ncbi:MAG: sn-glycerol-1-phosphate dehydrogenase [Sedimentisphaerales bacterium]|nr:sn-glycerol-1-phosphate dehydrogenase [Sedimentisphaerales bacterium]
MNSFEKETNERLEAAVIKADTTKKVVLGAGVIDSVKSHFEQCFGSKPVQIIADVNTAKAAGPAAIQHIKSAGSNDGLEPFIFSDPYLHADYENVEQIEKLLSNNDAIAVAIGSGTMNDLVKLASHNCNKEYMVVATAASVDGYTAYGASINRNNFKQTFFCPAPVVVLGDLDIIDKAPKLMNAAGYADLIAKVPAGADWILADALGVEEIDHGAWDLVQGSLRKWVGDPAGVQKGEHKSLVRLMEGLIMSGLAMQKANSSRPASGAEHQFSHLWDNLNHTHNGQTPLHGLKVGIGSLASEALYKALLELEPEDFCSDIEKIKSYWPSWQETESLINNYFGDDVIMAQQVLAQSREKYITVEQLAQRLDRLKAGWSKLKLRLKDQLLGVENLQMALRHAGAASWPSDISIDIPMMRRSYRQAHLIRKRYTILDCVLQSGHWDNCIESLFGLDGFWGKGR